MALFGRRAQEDAADDARLEAVVARAAALLGWEGHLAPGSETLVVTNGDAASVGITPALRSIPDGADDEQAARWIADHVRTVMRAVRENAPVEDWSVSAPRVRTVLDDVEARLPDGVIGSPLCRVVGDVLVEHVVVDYPDRIRHLTDVPEGWPLDADAVLAAGRQAVRDHETVEPYLVEHLAGSGVMAFSGSPYYSASHAPMLSEILELPPAGALVAVPGSHVLLVLPLTGQPLHAAIGELWSTSAELYAVADRPVSDAVFHTSGDVLSCVAFRSPPGSATDLTLTPHAVRLG